MTEFFITTLAQYATYYTENTGYIPGSAHMGMYGGATLIGLGLILLAGLIGGIVQSSMRASMREFSTTRAPLTGAGPLSLCPQCVMALPGFAQNAPLRQVLQHPLKLPAAVI